ncbi:chaperone Ric-8B isoform X2 [Brachyhypopomus gauderio]|uniref:chaperone Ric-8B isoform X2 n=1 Tax=Brachyhypopomus gauderio TaxID=698409 RepID=UPI0040425EDB
MDLSAILSQIENGDEDEIERHLQVYNTENCRTFSFDCKEEAARTKLCQGVLTVLTRPVPPRCQCTCLETMRILSRDKRVLGPVATPEGILTLAGLARIRLPGAGAQPVWEGESAVEGQVVVEALKCLCNVMFNSVAAQQVGVDLQLPQGLCAYMRSSGSAHHEVGLFSLRLLFLLSALRPDIRGGLCTETGAVGLLADMLERILDIRWAGPCEVMPPDDQAPPIPPEKVEQTMEALKALFNITLSSSSDSHNDHQLRLIAALMRHILMLRAETEDKTEEVHSHAINLLSNLPMSCLDALIHVPVQGGLDKYGGKNMDAVQVLVDFMEKRIDKGSNYKEGLTPVLSLMTESSRYHREIRRYLKAKVLPPLKDVKERPEVGSTVRNKLVRLMTHVDMGVKQGAAEFLFVLCKESVDNLLKYTGYGNAAGLLAARGLLGGGRGETEYSADEDSDTEEYKSVKPINPITGHIEEPMPNPIEDMTEEQKEYEAQKLANMIGELSRQQLIRPMGVRKDGSLAPLEEAVHACQVAGSSDSESD